VGAEESFGGPFRCHGSLDGGKLSGRTEKIENNNMGNRLYVGNLSFSATNDTVRTAFSAFGEITDVHVVSDRETGQSRGFGFVTMGSADAAMNGAMLDGRSLKVNEAEERQGGGGGGRGGGGGGGGRSGGGGGRGGGGGGRW
jgi:RNA recognition motif-containing protein